MGLTAFSLNGGYGSCRRLLTPGIDQNAPTGSRQRKRNTLADTSPCSSHDGDLPGEQV
jgi:hypothetical protein